MNFVNANRVNLNRSNNSLTFLARVNDASWQMSLFMVSLLPVAVSFYSLVLRLYSNQMFNWHNQKNKE